LSVSEGITVYRVSPEIRYIENSIIEITTVAGTSVFFKEFFDVERGLFSEIFDSPILQKGRLVGFFSSNGGQFVLNIRDIFCAELFHKIIELDLYPSANPLDVVIEAKFVSEDSVFISYFSGTEFEERTKFFTIAEEAGTVYNSR